MYPKSPVQQAKFIVNLQSTSTKFTFTTPRLEVVLGFVMEKDRLRWALNGPIIDFYLGIDITRAPLISTPM